MNLSESLRVDIDEQAEAGIVGGSAVNCQLEDGRLNVNKCLPGCGTPQRSRRDVQASGVCQYLADPFTVE